MTLTALFSVSKYPASQDLKLLKYGRKLGMFFWLWKQCPQQQIENFYVAKILHLERQQLQNFIVSIFGFAFFLSVSQLIIDKKGKSC